MNVPVSTNNIGSHPAARKTAPAKSREMRGPCSDVSVTAMCAMQ
jgi:hypothetical protein